MEALLRHFPGLSNNQIQHLESFQKLIGSWNEKINLISRKDIGNLPERHILHSLSIAKFIKFSPDTRVLDLGTGGGFPGLPLAIFFPEVSFTLIDGTGKKIRVVRDIIAKLELENVIAKHIRAEELKEKFEFIVSRAVAPADKLYSWSKPLLSVKQRNAIPNGIILLKGGNMKAELKLLPKRTYTEIINLSDYFDTPHFHEKFLLYIQG